MKGLFKLSTILALVLIAGVASATTLSIKMPPDPVIMSVDSFFDVFVELDTATDLEGLQFTLNYDSSFMSLKSTVANGACGTAATVGGLATASWTIRCNEPSPGTLSVAMIGVDENASAPSTLPVSRNFPTALIRISFNATAATTAGPSSMTLSNVILGDSNAAAIASSAPVGGSVTIFVTELVSLDLTNPVSGNPADTDPITVLRGNTVSFNVLLTSHSNSVAGTANDIGYDTNVFSNPQATIGQVATDAGKDIAFTTPSPGILRILVSGLNTNVIADGVVATVTFDVDALATPNSYTLSNTPSSTDPAGQDLTTIGSDAIVNVIESPLNVSKTASSFAAVGGNLTYFINYGNLGAQDTTNVIIRDTLPSNTTFVSATNGGSFDSQTGEVSWNVGTLTAGTTDQMVSFMVTVNSGLQDGTTISNTTYGIEADGIPAIPGAQVNTLARDPASVVQLDLSDGQGQQGGSGSVQINLTSGPFSVSGVGMDIAYDPSLLSNFGCTINPAIGSGTTPDKQCTPNDNATGDLKILVIGLNQNVIPDGLVATITFDVSANAACDSITPLLNTPSATEPSGLDINEVIGTNGTVTATCGPSVSSITPNLGTSFGGCPVAVGGAGFQTGATLTIDGNLASQISVSSDTLITGVAPAGTIPQGQASLVADVVVTNSDNQSSTPQALFTYVNPGDIRDAQGTLGNHDGAVSIGEVQSVINMFLTDTNVAPEADSSCNGSISIGEVQQTINSFLSL